MQSKTERPPQPWEPDRRYTRQRELVLRSLDRFRENQMHSLPRPFTNRGMLSGILLGSTTEFTIQTAYGSTRTTAPADAGVYVPLPLPRTRTLLMSLSLGKDKPAKPLSEASATQTTEQYLGPFSTNAATACKPRKRQTEVAEDNAAQSRNQSLGTFANSSATECMAGQLQAEVPEGDFSQSREQSLETLANSSATECLPNMLPTDISKDSAELSRKQSIETFGNSSVTEWQPRERRTEIIEVSSAQSGEHSLRTSGNSSVTECKPRKRRIEIAEVSAAQSREQSLETFVNTSATECMPYQLQTEVAENDVSQSRKQSFGTFANSSATECMPNHLQLEVLEDNVWQSRNQSLGTFAISSATECMPNQLQTEVPEDNVSQSREQSLETFSNSSATECMPNKLRTDIVEVSSAQSGEHSLRTSGNKSVTECRPRKRRTEIADDSAAKLREQSLGTFANSSATECMPNKLRTDIVEVSSAQSGEHSLRTSGNKNVTECKPRKRRTEIADASAAKSREQSLGTFGNSSVSECMPYKLQTEVLEDDVSQPREQSLETFANISAAGCMANKLRTDIAKVSAQLREQSIGTFGNSSVTEWQPRERRTEIVEVSSAQSGEHSIRTSGNSSVTECKPRKRRIEIAEVSAAQAREQSLATFENTSVYECKPRKRRTEVAEVNVVISREQSLGASVNCRATDYKSWKRKTEVPSPDYGGAKRAARNPDNWIEDIDAVRLSASPSAVPEGLVGIPEFEAVAKLISRGRVKGSNIFDRLNHVLIKSGLKLDVRFAMHPAKQHQSAAFECVVSSTGETLARTSALSKKRAKNFAFSLIWKKFAQVAQFQDAARLAMDGRPTENNSSEIMRQVFGKCGFTVDVQPPKLATQSDESPTFECVISSGCEALGYGSSPSREIAEHIALREAWNNLARFSKFDAAVKLIRTGKIIGPNSKDKLHQVFAKCGMTLHVVFQELPGQKRQNSLFECTVTSAGRTLGHASAGRKKLAKRLAFQQAWDSLAVAASDHLKSCHSCAPRAPSAIVERKRSSYSVMQTSVSRKKIRLLSTDGGLARNVEMLMAFQQLSRSCDIVSTMSATIANTLRGILGPDSGESEHALGCSMIPSSDDRTRETAKAKGSRKRRAGGCSPGTTSIATKVCRKDTGDVEDRSVASASPLASFSAVTKGREHRSKFWALAQQLRDEPMATTKAFANPQQAFARNSLNLDGLLEDMPPRRLPRSECPLCGDHVAQQQETVVNVLHTLYSTGGANGGEGFLSVGMLREKCRGQSLNKTGFPCLYSGRGKNDRQTLGNVRNHCRGFCFACNSTLSVQSSRGLWSVPAAYVSGSLLHAFRWARY